MQMLPIEYQIISFRVTALPNTAKYLTYIILLMSKCKYLDKLNAKTINYQFLFQLIKYHEKNIKVCSMYSRKYR